METLLFPAYEPDIGNKQGSLLRFKVLGLATSGPSLEGTQSLLWHWIESEWSKLCLKKISNNEDPGYK